MSALALLAEPNRVEILRLVWTQERAAGEIARCFRITFGAVSQHLGALWRGGLVRRRRDGKQIFYIADRAALGPLAAALEAQWAQQLGVLKTLAEAEQQRVDAAKARDSAPVARDSAPELAIPRQNTKTSSSQSIAALPKTDPRSRKPQKRKRT